MSTYSFSNISYCVVLSLMTNEYFQAEMRRGNDYNSPNDYIFDAMTSIDYEGLTTTKIRVHVSQLCAYGTSATYFPRTFLKNAWAANSASVGSGMGSCSSI